jgi:hypothetical protein
LKTDRKIDRQKDSNPILTSNRSCKAIYSSDIHDMISFIFVIVCGLLGWERICAVFSFISFIQICIVIGDPIIKRGRFKILGDPTIKRGRFKILGDPTIKRGRFKILGDPIIKRGRFKILGDPIIKRGRFKILGDPTIKRERFKILSTDLPLPHFCAHPKLRHHIMLWCFWVLSELR